MNHAVNISQSEKTSKVLTSVTTVHITHLVKWTHVIDIACVHFTRCVMCTVVTEVRTLLVFSLCDMLNLQCDWKPLSHCKFNISQSEKTSKVLTSVTTVHITHLVMIGVSSTRYIMIPGYFGYFD
jgi:hypothetical protein